MPRLVKPSETNDDGMNDTHIRESDHGGDDSLDTGERTHELRIWPPPRLQGYCVDHFLMECENYYEQENDRYNKLVTHSRQTFLEIQKKKNPSTQLISAPTRLQPSRRAKEKHLVLGTTPTTIPEATTAQGPQGHKGPLNLQFKPARLEKAFRESRQGAMLSILTEFHKKLELQKSWEDYRSSFESKIKEVAKRLLSDIENIQRGKTHTNCVFRGPLGLECRYCGFAGMVQDDEAKTMRKLAPPAAMHDIKPLSVAHDAKESELIFRGTDLIVDVCGKKTMVVLVCFKGLLDLCAELSQEQEAIPDSPTGLLRHLSSFKLRPGGISATGASRRLDEFRSGKEQKRRKYGAESNVQGDPNFPQVNKRPRTT